MSIEAYSENELALTQVADFSSAGKNASLTIIALLKKRL